MSTPTRRRSKTAAPASNGKVVPLPTFTPPEDLPGPPAETEMPLIDDLPEEIRTSGPMLGRPPAADSWTRSAGAAPTGHDGPTPTTTSSSDRLTTSDPKVARNAGVLLAAVLGAGFGIAAAVMARAGRRLRRPTQPETRDIARPLARILVRHVPASLITDDLADLGEAGAAVERYVTAGPVVTRHTPVQHIGMPDHGEPVDDPSPTTPAAPSAAQVWHDATTATDQQWPSALGDNAGPAPKVSYLQ